MSIDGENTSGAVQYVRPSQLDYHESPDLTEAAQSSLLNLDFTYGEGDFAFEDGDCAAESWFDLANSDIDGLTSPIGSQQESRRRQSFTAKQRQTLGGWVMSHASVPYPNKDDMEVLANSTGLSGKQISTYFSNFRRRRTDAIRQQREILRREASQTDNTHVPRNPSSYAILPSPREAAEQPERSRSINSKSPQMSSAATPASPLSSITTTETRRGRRIFSSESPNPSPDSPNTTNPRMSSNASSCSRCSRTFSRKSTLTRHVASIHSQIRVWICGKPTRSRSAPYCIGCRSSPPSTHCPHRTSECWARPPQSRTFYRKDAVKQHLTGYHGFRDMDVNDEIEEMGPSDPDPDSF